MSVGEGVVESLNAIFRDELLNTAIFPTVKSARDMATSWRLEYNHRRPHGALGYQAPAAYAARCQAPVAGSILTHIVLREDNPAGF